MEIKDFLSLTLPNRALPACASFIAGYVYSGGADPLTAALAVLTIITTYSAAAIYNNIRDIESDRVNSPDRPLARGAFPVWGAWVLLAALAAASLAMGLAVSPLFAAIDLVAIALGWVYSRYSKSMWYLSYGTLVTTHHVIPFVAGYTMNAGLSLSLALIVAFIAASDMLAISLKDYKDVRGDSLLGLRTLPIAFQPRDAAKITFIGLCMPLLLIWLPWSLLRMSLSFLAVNLATGAARMVLGFQLINDPSPGTAGSILKKFRLIILLQLIGWCFR